MLIFSELKRSHISLSKTDFNQKQFKTAGET